MRHKIICLSLLLVAAGISGCSGLSDVKSNGGSGSGGGGASSVTVTVSPGATTAVVNQTIGFQATVTGSTNTAVTWRVNGLNGGNSTVGTITAVGAYTAPATIPSPSTVTVTAVSKANTADSGSANVQIVAANPNQQAQNIPIKLGTSGGNAKDVNGQFCCSGTLGSLLERNGNFYILSNNHVLARSDLGSVGDSIIQPGFVDTNCSMSGTTTVADLSQFVNLQNSGANVDAAIAQILSGTVDTSGSILSLGATATGNTPDAGAPHAGNGITAIVGESVAKSGRTSGLTCSSVSAIAIAASVSYETPCGGSTTFNVNYTGQISVGGGSFSAFGDSGSLIVDQNTADPVALLYGGSDTDSVGNPVADVLSALADSQGNRPVFVGSSSAHQVIGCTLPANALKPAAAVAPEIAPARRAKAQRARDLNAPELLANPYIQAIGVGASIDHPGEPAVLMVVNPGQPPAALPDELDGIATRIIQGTAAGPHGIFEAEVADRLAPVVDTFAVQSISSQELARAKAVHAAHVSELLKAPGVQGVGISSSGDAPGQAALMIFVVRGVPRDPVPVTIDGLRTRVRESSRFTAGRRGTETMTGCKLRPGQAPTLAKPQ